MFRSPLSVQASPAPIGAAARRSQPFGRHRQPACGGTREAYPQRAGARAPPRCIQYEGRRVLSPGFGVRTCRRRRPRFRRYDGLAASRHARGATAGIGRARAAEPDDDSRSAPRAVRYACRRRYSRARRVGALALAQATLRQGGRGVRSLAAGPQPQGGVAPQAAKADQVYLAAAICADLEIEQPTFKTRGEAHDWLRARGGNPRFKYEPPHPDLDRLAQAFG